MRRREFLASLLRGAAVGAPFCARAESPDHDEALVPPAAQREQLVLDLQDASRRLAETDEHLSQVYLRVHQINCALAGILMAAGAVQKTHREPSDEVWFDIIARDGKYIGGLIREVFERAKSRREAASADVIA
jgi:hypothetical protein